MWEGTGPALQEERECVNPGKTGVPAAARAAMVTWWCYTEDDEGRGEFFFSTLLCAIPFKLMQ